MEEARRCLVFDPRVGLALLVFANLAAFSEQPFWMEMIWIGFLLLLMLLHRCFAMVGKSLLIFGGILCLQYWILSAAPGWVATSFSIFANYARRMMPCLMLGFLMLRRTPMPYLVAGMRKIHFPQQLIVAVSVTLRYFPAIREETGYIRDAMRLRGIRGLAKLEGIMVPLMVSATGTTEELSAAAVTRGIEDPAPKTSLVELRASPVDGAAFLVGVGLTVALLTVKLGVFPW